MKTLMLALAAASMAVPATPAVSQQATVELRIGDYNHRYYDDRYNRRYYGNRYYQMYHGPVYRQGSVFRCLRHDGRWGLLRDRYNRVIVANPFNSYDRYYGRIYCR